MAKKKRNRKKEFTYKDFRVILELPDRLAQYLRLLFRVDKATWDFALAKIRQGEAYKEWSKSKGRGKGRRYFAAPCEELKRVQRAILNSFLSSIPVHFIRHGNQKGSSIMTSAGHHSGARDVFSVDIVNAFPTTFRSRIAANLRKPFAFALRQFESVMFTEDEEKLMLEALCDFVSLHDRLPQGPPTSPRIFDLVCMKMDKDLWKVIEDITTPFQQYKLTAWMDDITVSSDGPIPDELKHAIVSAIEEQGFIISTRPDKMKHFSPETGEVPVVLGLVLNPDGRITMAPRKVNSLRGKLHRAVTGEAWTAETAGRVAGWLGFIRQVYPKNLPSKLRSIVEASEQRLAHETLRRIEKTAVAASGHALYTDGAASGNPGPASIGVVLLKDGSDVDAFAVAIGTATNNIAEYRALIAGLEAAVKHGITELDCFSDSALVVGQLTGEYKVESDVLRPYYLRVLELVPEVGSVRFHLIAREQNGRADALAKDALDKATLKKKPTSKRTSAKKGKKGSGGPTDTPPLAEAV